MSGHQQEQTGKVTGFSAVFKAFATRAGNPYHGPNGRFSTKEKAKVVSPPGKQKKLKSSGFRSMFGLRG